MNAYFKQALCHGTLATGTSTKQNKKTGIAERSATTDLMNQADVQTKKEREMGGMEKILLSNYSADYSKITGMGGFPLILTLELFD